MTEPAEFYGDLPGWCRPGALVGLETWPNGGSSTFRRARIARITKTRVVYAYTRRDGSEVEDYVPRVNGLSRYGTAGGRGGARLHAIDAPAYLDGFAVQRTKALHRRIDQLFAARQEARMIRGEERPDRLTTRAEALDLLDEITAEVVKLRNTIAAQLDQEGA